MSPNSPGGSDPDNPEDKRDGSKDPSVVQQEVCSSEGNKTSTGATLPTGRQQQGSATAGLSDEELGQLVIDCRLNRLRYKCGECGADKVQDKHGVDIPHLCPALEARVKEWALKGGKKITRERVIQMLEQAQRMQDKDASTATESHKVRSSTSEAKAGQSSKAKKRGEYKCGVCGVPKKGHICPFAKPSKKTPKKAIATRAATTLKTDDEDFQLQVEETNTEEDHELTAPPWKMAEATRKVAVEPDLSNEAYQAPLVQQHALTTKDDRKPAARPHPTTGDDNQEPEAESHQVAKKDGHEQEAPPWQDTGPFASVSENLRDNPNDDLTFEDRTPKRHKTDDTSTEDQSKEAATADPDPAIDEAHQKEPATTEPKDTEADETETSTSIQTETQDRARAELTFDTGETRTTENTRMASRRK